MDCRPYTVLYSSYALAQPQPMRPKARGLAQHDGPPVWLEESDSSVVILYVYRMPFPYLTGPYRSPGGASC
jgi:hypothetical protein